MFVSSRVDFDSGGFCTRVDFNSISNKNINQNIINVEQFINSFKAKSASKKKKLL